MLYTLILLIFFQTPYVGHPYLTKSEGARKCWKKYFFTRNTIKADNWLGRAAGKDCFDSNHMAAFESQKFDTLVQSDTKKPHDTIYPLNIANIHNIDLIPATPLSIFWILLISMNSVYPP